MTMTTITQLPDPSGFSADPFTDIIREGARKLIEQAIQAELTALMAAFADEKLENGTSRLVRHGHLPEREVMTGIGPVPVKVPRVRDRKPGEEKISFVTPPLIGRRLCYGGVSIAGRGSPFQFRGTVLVREVGALDRRSGLERYPGAGAFYLSPLVQG